MRLTIIEGRGSVALWVMSADDGTGRTSTIVTDPRNETRPGVDFGSWVADTGGTVPMGDILWPAESNGRGSSGSAPSSST
jgi:hypothetical protein